MALPPELYQAIIENVNKEDLYNLLFVSRTVSYEVERVLYHAIQITPKTPLSMEFLLHLTRCQRVACHVRKLNISGRIRLVSLTDDTGIPSLADYWHALNQALCALTNLRQLSISMVVRAQNTRLVSPPSSIFSKCNFKLEVFDFYDDSKNSFPPLDLSQVKELRLTFPSATRSIVGFSPDAFLSLRIFSSSLTQFLDLGIENSRRIKAFELWDHTQLALNTTFTNITSLKFHSGPHSGLRFLPSLRYFYTFLGPDLAPLNLDRLVGLLSVLKDLEKLCLVMFRIPWASDGHVKLFSAISSLQELVIANSDRGTCWNRNGMNPVPVSRDIIENEWRDPRWL